MPSPAPQFSDAFQESEGLELPESYGKEREIAGCPNLPLYASVFETAFTASGQAGLSGYDNGPGRMFYDSSIMGVYPDAPLAVGFPVPCNAKVVIPSLGAPSGPFTHQPPTTVKNVEFCYSNSIGAPATGVPVSWQQSNDDIVSGTVWMLIGTRFNNSFTPGWPSGSILRITYYGGCYPVQESFAGGGWSPGPTWYSQGLKSGTWNFYWEAFGDFGVSSWAIGDFGPVGSNASTGFIDFNIPGGAPGLVGEPLGQFVYEPAGFPVPGSGTFQFTDTRSCFFRIIAGGEINGQLTLTKLIGARA